MFYKEFLTLFSSDKMIQHWKDLVVKENGQCTVIQNAKSHSEICFDVVWLLYNIFA